MARVLCRAHRAPRPAGTLIGVAGFLALAAFTELCFVFRYRFALRLGEAVVHDLRDDGLRAPACACRSSFFSARAGRRAGRAHHLGHRRRAHRRPGRRVRVDRAGGDGADLGGADDLLRLAAVPGRRDHGAGRVDAGAPAARPAGPGAPRSAGELLARDRDAGRERGRHPRDPELRAREGQRRAVRGAGPRSRDATTWAPPATARSSSRCWNGTASSSCRWCW